MSEIAERLKAGFLVNYMQYMEGCETPPIYNRWAGLSTLASVVSRKVWINYGRFRVFPVMYIVLVGPSGGRKTTAMNVSKKFLEELGTVHLSATATTKEKLVQRMAKECVKTFTDPTNQKLTEYTPITLCLTELSQFIGTNTQLAAHMIDFLVASYDEEHYKAETIGRGTDIIPNPCINILACTTPHHIATYLKADVISGGFARRNLFVYEQDDGAPQAWPEETTEQRNQKEACLWWLQKLDQEAVGEFKWSEEARAFWTPWYNTSFETMRKMPDSPIRGYFKSKHEQVLRVAILLALSESSKLVLERGHLEAALAVLEEAESRFNRVFMGLGRNELHTIAMQALAMIERIGGRIKEKQLHVALVREAPMKDYMEIVKYLTDISGELVQVNEPGYNGLIKARWLVLRDKADAVREEFAKAAETLVSEVPPSTHTDSSAGGSPAQ